MPVSTGILQSVTAPHARNALAAGLAISLALHAALGFGFYSWKPVDNREVPEPERPWEDDAILLALEPPPEPAPEPPEARPGMDEASTDDPVWLGVTESPTEHFAPEGGVDQAGFEMAEGGETAEEAEAPALPEPEPVRPRVEPPTRVAATPVDPTELLKPLRGLAAEVASAAEATLPLLEQLIATAMSAAASEPVLPAEESAPASVVPPTASASASAPGPPIPPGAIVADRQSDATSREQPLEVKPGRPLAGRGLDIRTVRPTWPITVTLLAIPRNPLVEITFGRTGRVLRASYVFGQDTGYSDVDGPLLDAVYRWTATGKALAELPPDDPDAGVTLRIRILIR